MQNSLIEQNGNQVKKEKIGFLILTIIGILALLGMFISSPIEQKQAYHNFSDEDTILNVPNFWNVISNLPFLIVGLLGIFNLRSIANENIQYLVFFIGIALVSIGSSYYHVNPNDSTLVWDRLPMTIAFMALSSIVISEFIDFKNGRLILFPVLLLGLLSVLYWVKFNDLRFFALVQYYPMLAIPVILIFFKSDYDLTIGYWFLLLAYIIAKLFEHFDYQVHSYLEWISGHTLKHIATAIGVFALLNTYIRRRKTI